MRIRKRRVVMRVSIRRWPPPQASILAVVMIDGGDVSGDEESVVTMRVKISKRRVVVMRVRIQRRMVMTWW